MLEYQAQEVLRLNIPWPKLSVYERSSAINALLDRDFIYSSHPFLANQKSVIANISPDALYNLRTLLESRLLENENAAPALAQYFKKLKNPFFNELAGKLKSEDIRIKAGLYGEESAFGGHTFSDGKHTIYVNLNAVSPDGFLETLVHESIHCLQRANIVAGICNIREGNLSADDRTRATARLSAFIEEVRAEISKRPDLIEQVCSDARLNNAFFAKRDSLDQTIEFAADLICNPRVVSLLKSLDRGSRGFLDRSISWISSALLNEPVNSLVANAYRDALLLASTRAPHIDLSEIAESASITPGKAQALGIAENIPAQLLVGRNPSLFAGVSNSKQYSERRELVLADLRDEIARGVYCNTAINLKPYEDAAGRKLSTDESDALLGEMRKRQSDIHTGWSDYLANGGYSSEVQILILQSVVKELAVPKPSGWTLHSLGGNTDKMHILPSPEVVGAVAGALSDPQNMGKRVSVLLAEASARAEELSRQRRETFVAPPSQDAGPIHWVRFKSKDNDPVNFQKNVQELTALAATSSHFGQCSWCTGTGAAEGQLAAGDFYCGVDEKGRARVAVRTENGMIAEIRGILSGQNLEPAYAQSVLALVKEKKLTGGEKFVKDAQIKGLVSVYENSDQSLPDLAKKLHAAAPEFFRSFDEKEILRDIINYKGVGYGACTLAPKGSRLYRNAFDLTPASIFRNARDPEEPFTADFLTRAFHDGAPEVLRHNCAPFELYTLAANYEGPHAWLYREAACNAYCPGEIINKLASDTSPEFEKVRCAALRNPFVSEGVLIDALNKSNPETIRAEAARNTSATDAVLRKAIQDPRKIVRVNAAAHQNASEFVLLKAIDDRTIDVRSAVMRRASLPESVLLKALSLGTDDKNNYAATAMKHADATPAVLRAGMDRYPFFAAAHDRATDEIILNALKLAPHDTHIASNAKSEAIQMFILDAAQKLEAQKADTPSWQVSQAQQIALSSLVSNPHATEKVIERIYEIDPSKVVKNEPKNISEGLLRKIYRDNDPQNRAFVAKHERCTGDLLFKAANDDDERVRVAVTSNPVATPEVLQSAASKGGATAEMGIKMWENIASHKNADEKLLESAFEFATSNGRDRSHKNSSWLLIRTICRHPSATGPLLRKIYDSESDDNEKRSLLGAISRHPRLPTDLLQKAVDSEFEEIRVDAAGSPALTPAMFKKFQNDQSHRVRHFAFSNPAASESLLISAFKGNDKEFQLKAARNPGATPAVLRAALDSPSDLIRQVAERNPNMKPEILAVKKESAVKAVAVKEVDKSITRSQGGDVYSEYDGQFLLFPSPVSTKPTRFTGICA